jgi:hypothetical protein
MRRTQVVLIMPAPVNRGEFDGLSVMDEIPGEVSEKELDRHQYGRQRASTLTDKSLSSSQVVVKRGESDSHSAKRLVEGSISGARLPRQPTTATGCADRRRVPAGLPRNSLIVSTARATPASMGFSWPNKCSPELSGSAGERRTCPPGCERFRSDMR